MKTCKWLAVILILVIGVSFPALAEKNIIVFHAGSLSVPFKLMAEKFEKLHPQYKVILEASGSRMAARKIADLHRPCDVMASADYTVINNLLIKTGNAKFNVLFATNQIAIVFTNKSRYANIINSKNWPYILLKKGVVIGVLLPSCQDKNPLFLR